MAPDHLSNTFTPILDIVAKEHGLIPAAVYGAIYRRCQMRRGVCDASMGKMAKSLGVSRQTFHAQVQYLIEVELVIDQTPDAKGIPHTFVAVPVNEVDSPSTNEVVNEIDNGCKEDLQGVSSSFTTPVKELDTRILGDKEETSKRLLGANAPPAERPKKPLTGKNKIAHELAEHFSQASGIPIPRVKTAKEGRAFGERWKKPLLAIYDLSPANGANRLITETITQMRQDKLTIAAPQSIVSVATSIFANGRASPKPQDLTLPQIEEGVW